MEPPEERAAHEARPATTPTGGGPLPPEQPPPAARIPAARAERPADPADPPGAADPARERSGPRPEEIPGAAGDGGRPGDGGPLGYAGPPSAGALGELSLTGRLVVAVAVAAVCVGAVFHLGMVFLHVAPTNTLSTRYATALSGYIYPEFEQNWKLFAPDPVQSNVDIQARAQVRTAGGSTTTGWVDLTAMDDRAILHNPFPSHTEQNELRRSWDFYTSAHDDQDRPVGLRGGLSKEYLLRIVASRFGPHLNGGTVTALQVRSSVAPVGSPPWSAQRTSTTVQYHPLSWWDVTPEDFS